MSSLYCGIDFGTSNSSIAVSSAKEAPKLVAVENNQVAVPSSIFYEPENPHPLFGRQAVNAYVQGAEGRFMRSLKRVLGTDLMSTGTAINGKSVKFENVLVQFISYLKKQAEQSTQTEINSVVMGRPVHFRDNDAKGDAQAQRELETISKNVGFKNIVFQYEPIAAAFAHENKISGEKLACVIDIGGGTSDFSIIRIGKGLSSKIDRSSDILASGGIRIGGNDFDKSLSLISFMPELGLNTTFGDKNLPVPTIQYHDLAEWSKVNSVYSYANRKIVNEVLSNAHQPELYGRLLEVLDKEKGHTLLGLVEDAKIALTTHRNYQTILKFLQDKPVVKSVKTDFEHAIASNLCKVSCTIEECLKLAQVKASQIEVIVLTGGSTEIPFVQKTLCAHFPHAEISAENKLASVGLGLAYDALRRF